MYMLMHVHTNPCMYTHTYTHTHMHTRMRTHVCAPTYTHTHTQGKKNRKTSTRHINSDWYVTHINQKYQKEDIQLSCKLFHTQFPNFPARKFCFSFFPQKRQSNRQNKHPLHKSTLTDYSALQDLSEVDIRSNQLQFCNLCQGIL